MSEEFKLMGQFIDKNDSCTIGTCDLVFEKDIPYAVWAISPDKEIWAKLDKKYLQTVNEFIGIEFINYLYQIPIRIYEKKI